MHVPQTSLKPRRRRDHEACSKKVFWLWLQRLVWFFSAGGPGLPKHCNIGKTSITLSINDLCIHLFLHTKLQCFGLLTQFRNMTFPILCFFFFQNPHFVVDDSTSLTPGGQDGGSRCESIACAEIRKGGWLQELPVVESQSNRLVFRGVSSSPRFLGWKFFFSAGSFVFCPDSFLIEVVKH